MREDRLIVEISVVDSIYRGINEFPPWQGFIRLFRKAMGGHMASLQLYSYSLESSRLSVTDTDPSADIASFHAQFLNHYREADFLFRPAQPGTVITFSDMIPREELLRSEFYRSFMKPNDLGDAIRFGLSEPGGAQAWIDAGRKLNGTPFGEAEKNYCLALIPYFERALAIYSQLKRSEAEKQVYESLTEQLTVGIVLLDDSSRIVRTNDMAESLLAGDKQIFIRNRQLAFRDPGLQKDFERIFGNALDQRTKHGLPVGIEALSIRQNDDSLIGLLVKAIPETRWHTGAGYPAVVVCICDPTQHQDARQTFVSQLFGLTVSEARLAILLAEGITLAEAADILKVTEHTTRAVSKRIFSKMGVNRQADLVRIILRSTALLT